MRRYLFKEDAYLTNYMKSIIWDMASNDYEVGHPLSEEDALEWFESGEDSDIPVELALEATYYYFEAFDEIREEDNNEEEEFEEPRRYSARNKISGFEKYLKNKSKKIKEDFEFYKAQNGKIGVDKVVSASSKSGKVFKDGSDNKGDEGIAIKRIPLTKMSPEDKALAKAAYKTLSKDNSIKKIDKTFKVNPKPDVVMKSDGVHADIYYDDNTTGEPDEKDVRLVASRRMPKNKSIREEEVTDRSFDKLASHIDEAFELANGNLPESNLVLKYLNDILEDYLETGWFDEYGNPNISPNILAKINILKKTLENKESGGYFTFGDLYDQIYDLIF